MNFHKPVLLEEVISSLKVEIDKWYLDATLGDGGYSLAILKKGGWVVGIDQDPNAINRAYKRVSELDKDYNFQFIQGNFENLEQLVDKTKGSFKSIEELDIKSDRKFAGIVYDLGFSSYQIDSGERGFAFSKEGDLDMRMNPELTVKAADLINGLGKGELKLLFEKYGEFNDIRVVNAILEERKKEPITKTTQLAHIIEKAVKYNRGKKIHPATQVFQALRIAVNDEIHVLENSLPQAFSLLEDKGKILIVTFHSLEDRIVKNKFLEWEKENKGKVLTPKPIVPTEIEISQNPRSRSAKLRVFQKHV